MSKTHLAKRRSISLPVPHLHIWDAFNQVADYPEPPTTSFWPDLFVPAEPHPEVLAHLLAAGADPNARGLRGSDASDVCR